MKRQLWNLWQFLIKFIKDKRLMINDCKSLKLFEHLQRPSQIQINSQNRQFQSDHRPHCEPSQYNSQSQSSLQRQIQQFKKDIELRFQLSIANKLYTFPKRIKTIYDILSSQQEESNQEKSQIQVKRQRKMSKLARERDSIKSKSRKRINTKESAQKLNSNSISPLKSKHLRDTSTNKKKDRNLKEKSASKTKRHPKPIEQKQKNDKTSKPTSKKPNIKESSISINNDEQVTQSMISSIFYKFMKKHHPPNNFSTQSINQKSMRGQGPQMRLISPPIDSLLTDIKLIFLNPYHYTYVLQKEDNFIYLYDEMTMDVVGKSKVPFNQNFKMLAFTDNFNGFCTYLEAKPNQNQTAQIIMFNLEQDGTIVHHRCPLTKNKVQQNLALFNISFIEKEKDRQAYLVGLGRNRIYFINLKGEVVKDIEIRYGSKELSLVNGFTNKQNKWIFVQQNTVYFATVTFEQYNIEDQITLKNKIASIFLDASIRGDFMAFITQLHTVVILANNRDKWRITHRFQIPNLNIRKLCFFYPAANTSTTNKFKDKLFLIIHGDVNYMYDPNHIKINEFQTEIQQEKVDNFPIPQEFVSEKAIFIYEYGIDELMHPKESLIQPKNMFCIRDIGAVKYTIWANEHAENCIRVFKEDRTIQNVDLISLLPGQYIGKQWVNLGYKFEPRSHNVIYEETQNNFQKQKIEYQHVTDEELNDWSYSLFPKEVLMRKSIRRLNCINFD